MRVVAVDAAINGKVGIIAAGMATVAGRNNILSRRVGGVAGDTVELLLVCSTSRCQVGNRLRMAGRTEDCGGSFAELHR